jgi:WD40 repeat protein
VTVSADGSIAVWLPQVVRDAPIPENAALFVSVPPALVPQALVLPARSASGHSAADDTVPIVKYAPEFSLMHVVVGGSGSSANNLVPLRDTMPRVSLVAVQRIEGAHANKYVLAAAATPNGAFLVTGGADAAVRVWCSPVPLKEHLCLTGHTGSINALAVTSDSSDVVSASTDGSVRLWRIATGTLLRVFHAHYDVLDARPTRHDLLLLTCAADGAMAVWSLDQGSAISRLACPAAAGSTNSICANSDCSLIFTGSDDGNIRVWDASTGSSVAVLSGHIGAVVALQCVRNDRLLVSGSVDCTLRVWSLGSLACLTVLFGHADAVESFSILPSLNLGDLIVSCGRDRSILVWFVPPRDDFEPVVRALPSSSSGLSRSESLGSRSDSGLGKRWGSELSSASSAAAFARHSEFDTALPVSDRPPFHDEQGLYVTQVFRPPRGPAPIPLSEMRTRLALKSSPNIDVPPELPSRMAAHDTAAPPLPPKLGGAGTVPVSEPAYASTPLSGPSPAGVAKANSLREASGGPTAQATEAAALERSRRRSRSVGHNSMLTLAAAMAASAAVAASPAASISPAGVVAASSTQEAEPAAPRVEGSVAVKGARPIPRPRPRESETTGSPGAQASVDVSHKNIAAAVETRGPRSLSDVSGPARPRTRPVSTVGSLAAAKPHEEPSQGPAREKDAGASGDELAQLRQALSAAEKRLDEQERTLAILRRTLDLKTETITVRDTTIAALEAQLALVTRERDVLMQAAIAEMESGGGWSDT